MAPDSRLGPVPDNIYWWRDYEALAKELFTLADKIEREQEERGEDMCSLDYDDHSEAVTGLRRTANMLLSDDPVREAFDYYESHRQRFEKGASNG